MYDSGKVIIGILIFLFFMTSPLWYNLALGSGETPNPVIQTQGEPGRDKCVLDAAYMKDKHMAVLNDWRDKVVRQEERVFRAEDGRKFNMSLSKTCLNCHSNKTEFCDRCHNYASVDPYCWKCHLTPEDLKNEP